MTSYRYQFAKQYLLAVHFTRRCQRPRRRLLRDHPRRTGKHGAATTADPRTRPSAGRSPRTLDGGAQTADCGPSPTSFASTRREPHLFVLLFSEHFHCRNGSPTSQSKFFFLPSFSSIAKTAPFVELDSICIVGSHLHDHFPVWV